MIPGTAQIDFEAALQDPKAFFSEPQDVVDYPALSRERKLAILLQWEQDAPTRDDEGDLGVHLRRFVQRERAYLEAGGRMLFPLPRFEGVTG